MKYFCCRMESVELTANSIAIYLNCSIHFTRLQIHKIEGLTYLCTHLPLILSTSIKTAIQRVGKIVHEISFVIDIQTFFLF